MPAILAELISDFTPDQRFTLVIVGVACLTGAVVVLGIMAFSSWCWIRSREQRTELTRDLLDQGKSAEEIERILNPSDGFTRSMENWFGGGRRKR
ncbi:hypothetical protein Pla108_15800 [Botrimarina colliarenosi]|uniref:Uncharacterized protein n=1 Tax=Botrimarina colliarenosi TaxID=2528001 RepID=A0A5C6AMB0_9BACT|nr:hypothetical protein [Botrimarina colliarenosi]TWU00628.1 hypothetical protein Pla108_15800 [Botrimarina colliarenosi]